jgi:hypothetical protein
MGYIKRVSKSEICLRRCKWNFENLLSPLLLCFFAYIDLHPSGVKVYLFKYVKFRFGVKPFSLVLVY